MLRLTIAFTAPWSADGFVWVSPDAIAAAMRRRPSGSVDVPYTSIALRVADGEADTGMTGYSVKETPEQIHNMILALRQIGY